MPVQVVDTVCSGIPLFGYLNGEVIINELRAAYPGSVYGKRYS